MFTLASERKAGRSPQGACKICSALTGKDPREWEAWKTQRELPTILSSPCKEVAVRVSLPPSGGGWREGLGCSLTRHGGERERRKAVARRDGKAETRRREEAAVVQQHNTTLPLEARGSRLLLLLRLPQPWPRLLQLSSRSVVNDSSPPCHTTRSSYSPPPPERQRHAPPPPPWRCLEYGTSRRS